MVRVTSRTSSWARAMPSPKPRSVAGTARRSVSPATSVKTSPRVTPSARKVPSSERRCTTEKVTVL